jgi:transcriptional regulator of acetoin/glycerol metabolism
VAAALDQVQGNISRAARLLGVSRAALYRKLDKHGL